MSLLEQYTQERQDQAYRQGVRDGIRKTDLVEPAIRALCIALAALCLLNIYALAFLLYPILGITFSYLSARPHYAKEEDAQINIADLGDTE